MTLVFAGKRISSLVLGATLLLAAGASPGAGAAKITPADHRQHLESVEQASKAEVERVAQWYEDYSQERPFDVAGAVEGCKFLEAFAASFEYLAWADEIDAKQTACNARLRERFGDHPEVELHELDSLYGDELVERGNALVERLGAELWTRGQMARLYTRMAVAYQASDPAKAKQFALMALEVDRTADVRLIAAHQLIEEGDRDGALELLTSPMDTHDPAEYWYASEKMQLLTQLGAYTQARGIYDALKASGNAYDAVAASKLLRKMAAVDAARAELQSETAQWRSGLVARERYLLEYEAGTPQQALAAYNALRDTGYKADPFAINRAALLTRDIGLPWRPRDLLGLLSAGGLLLAAAVLMLVPVGVVHYRGLAVRARTGERAPAPGGWHLRHVWLILSGYMAANVAALYLAGPFDLLGSTGSFWAMTAEPEQLSRMAIGAEVLMLFFAATIAQGAGRPQLPWTQDWSVVKAIGLGLGIGLALRTPLLLKLALSHPVRAGLLKDPVTQLVIFISEHYGVVCATWLLCVAAPVLEEFICRGVLLRAFSRHVSFAWANVLQAALFTLAHMDLRATPFLFVFGIVAGICARRSGGLLVCIVMHATANAVVAAVVLS